MKKFTETKTATVVKEMCAEPESTIEITITNDFINSTDDEDCLVSFFSSYKCKAIEWVFAEYPTDDDLEQLIKKYEHCDYVMF